MQSVLAAMNDKCSLHLVQWLWAKVVYCDGTSDDLQGNGDGKKDVFVSFLF